MACESQYSYKRRDDTMVGTKAIRLPASLCSLEYLRILLASRNCNKSAMLSDLCLHARTEVPVANDKFCGVWSRVKVHAWESELATTSLGMADEAHEPFPEQAALHNG